MGTNVRQKLIKQVSVGSSKLNENGEPKDRAERKGSVLGSLPRSLSVLMDRNASSMYVIVNDINQSIIIVFIAHSHYHIQTMTISSFLF